jgi:hypothetical protein
METAPQTQSIISTQDVSLDSAMKTLQKFLAVQKKYFLEHETDDLSNDENDEEIFNMDDDKLGYEEFEQRLTAMIDSLQEGYYTSEPIASPSAKEALISETNTEDDLPSKLSSNESMKESENIENSSESIDDTDGSEEMKKAMKKESKKSKKEAKKAEKEVKKAEKEKQKKMKKEKKEKRKREKNEEKSAKRSKIKAE